MTVETDTNVATGIGNGATTVFPFNFLVFTADTLSVTFTDPNTGVVTTVPPTDYFISGLGNAEGGSVTFNTAPADNIGIIIKRTVPNVQPLDLINQSGFYPDTLERQLDLTVMQIQQLDEITGRALVVPVGETGTTLPSAEDRAGMFPVFLPDGSIGTSFGTGADLGLRQDIASTDSDKGAALTAWKQDFAGAADQSVYERLLKTVFSTDAITSGTDNGAALNTIIAGIGGASGDLGFGQSYIPRGDWTVGETVLSAYQSVQFKGVGRPVLTWTGAAGGTMFQIQDSSSHQMENMVLLGGGVIPDKAIYYDDTLSVGAQDSGTNQFISLHRLSVGRRWAQDAEIHSGVNNGFVYGFYAGGPNLVNNDKFRIRDCQFFDCSGAGVMLASNQSIWGIIDSVLFDTCGYGLDTRSSTTALNISFNRNTIADLRVRDNIAVEIFGFNAENSKLLIEQANNASVRINGGKVVLVNSLMTGGYWAQFTQANEIHLENWWVEKFDTVGKKLQITASPTQRGTVLIRHCRLPDGDTRAAYELNAPANSGGLIYDIKQGSFKARGTLDGSQTYDPASMASGTALLNSQAMNATASLVAGEPCLVSAGVDLNGVMLTGNIYTNNLLYSFFANRTGGDVDLPSAKLRWRKLPKEAVQAQLTTAHDYGSLADGGSENLSFSVPCSFGDFVYWGMDSAGARVLTLSAYVSAANTAQLNATNLFGSVANPAVANYTLHVLRESIFDFIGAAVVDPVAIDPGAGLSVTVPVKGAKIGDFAVAAFGANLQGLSHTVNITADDTARVRFHNPTGSAIDLSPLAIRVGVLIALS